MDVFFVRGLHRSYSSRKCFQLKLCREKYIFLSALTQQIGWGYFLWNLHENFKIKWDENILKSCSWCQENQNFSRFSFIKIFSNFSSSTLISDTFSSTFCILTHFYKNQTSEQSDCFNLVSRCQRIKKKIKSSGKLKRKGMYLSKTNNDHQKIGPKGGGRATFFLKYLFLICLEIFKRKSEVIFRTCIFNKNCPIISWNIGMNLVPSTDCQYCNKRLCRE